MLAKRGDALNLAGEVGVVNTSPVPVVKGQVIGGRWEVEEFRYGLYTMLPDGSQALSGSPAWVEASMPIELDEAGAAAYSGNGVRLLGAGTEPDEVGESPTGGRAFHGRRAVRARTISH